MSPSRQAVVHSTLAIVGVFALALTIRLAFVLFYPQLPPERCGDCRMYDEVGWNLAAGRGFVDGFSRRTILGEDTRGPGAPEVGVGPVYPAFLGALYRLFGHNITAVRVAQAVLGALTSVLVFLIVSTFAIPASALTAGAAVALWPPLIVYSGMPLTETVFAFLLVLLVFMVAYAARTGSVWFHLIAGAILGVTILIREETLLLAFAYPALMLWKSRTRRTIVNVAVLLLVAAASVGSWTLRNYRLFNEVILVGAHGGDTIWISAKGWTEWDFDDPEIQGLVKGLSYLEQNHVLRREGLRLIAADPLGYLRTRARRMPDFWVSSHTTYLDGFSESFGQYSQRGEYGRLALKLILLLMNVAVAVLAAGGVLMWLRRQPSWDPLAWVLVPIVVVAVTHFFLFAAPRYQVPILPLLVVFAAVLLTSPSRSMERRVRVAAA